MRVKVRIGEFTHPIRQYVSSFENISDIYS